MAKKNKDLHKKALPVKTIKYQPNIPLALIYILFGFWAYIVLKNYFQKFPVNLDMLAYILSLKDFSGSNGIIIANWVSHLTSILLVTLLYLSAFGTGQRLWKLMGLKGAIHGEDTLFSLGLGFGCIIFLTFLLGIAGLLYKNVFWVVFGLLGTLGIFELKKTRDTIQSTGQKKSEIGLTFADVLLYGVFFIACLVSLVTALTPEIFYDSMQYHLGVPLIWMQNHRIVEIPTIQQSYYQMNIHLLYVISLLLKNESLAKLLNWSFGILTSFSIYVFAKKYFSKSTGILASAIFVSIPMVMFVSSRSCIELPISFFETMALLAVANWLDKKEDKWLYVCAIFSGIAIGSKHTSASCVVSLLTASVLFFALWKRQEMPSLWKKLGIFLIINLIVFSPWLIKNTVMTGNPIHPFVINFKVGIKQVVKGSYMGYSDQVPLAVNIKNIVTVPWRGTMGEFQESFSGAVLLLLVPVVFFFRKTKDIIKFSLIYITVYYLLWIKLGGGYIRLATPAFPLACLIGAHYISDSKFNGVFKWLMKILIVYLCLTNVYFIMGSQKMSQNPLGYILGMQSKKEYLSIQRPTYPCPSYQTIDWANENLPKGSGIAFFGETRPCYSKHKVITQSAVDFNQIILWCKEVNSKDELRDKLQKEEITHILFNVPEANRLKCYDIFQFEEKDFTIFLDFWNKYVKEIYASISDVVLNNGQKGSLIPEFWAQYTQNPYSYVYLYEIMSGKEALQAHNPPYNFFLNKEMYNEDRYEKIKNVAEKGTGQR